MLPLMRPSLYIKNGKPKCLKTGNDMQNTYISESPKSIKPDIILSSKNELSKSGHTIWYAHRIDNEEHPLKFSFPIYKEDNQQFAFTSLVLYLKNISYLIEVVKNVKKKDITLEDLNSWFSCVCMMKDQFDFNELKKVLYSNITDNYAVWLPRNKDKVFIGIESWLPIDNNKVSAIKFQGITFCHELTGIIAEISPQILPVWWMDFFKQAEYENLQKALIKKFSGIEKIDTSEICGDNPFAELLNPTKINETTFERSRMCLKDTNFISEFQKIKEVTGDNDGENGKSLEWSKDLFSKTVIGKIAKHPVEYQNEKSYRDFIDTECRKAPGLVIQKTKAKNKHRVNMTWIRKQTSLSDKEILEKLKAG